MWTAGGLTLSGLSAEPDGRPVGTVLALHGGGYSAGYWDHPLDPTASLLRLGAERGYRVVAIDRPGYGASHGIVRDAVRVGCQTEVVLDLIARLDGPVALVGHSMGSILALHVAAAGHPSIAAVEISGLPFVFDDSLVDRDLLASLDFLPDNSEEFRRQLFYGPDGTFDPAVLEADTVLTRPIPAAEIIDAADCPTSTPMVAPTITVPIRITRAEFEISSGGDVEGLERCAALFTASPRVVAHVQPASGHNISLHRVAGKYHASSLDFLDSVLA